MKPKRGRLATVTSIGARRQAKAANVAEILLPAKPEVAQIDGRRIVLEGVDELVLRCGKASITLRRNGKIVIRGVQIETRAAGSNKIRGGSVQIN